MGKRKQNKPGKRGVWCWFGGGVGNGIVVDGACRDQDGTNVLLLSSLHRLAKSLFFVVFSIVLYS